MPYEKIGKNDPVCIADEVPFEIPESWEWVRLGNLTYNHGQKKPSSEFCYIDIGSIDNQHQRLNEKETIVAPENAASRARKIVKTGDILYSTVRPYLHNMCIIDREFTKETIASTGFAVLKCCADYSNAFLFYYMMSPDFDNYANDSDNSKGVAYPAINDERLSNALIPVAPVMEQYRILNQLSKVLPIVQVYDGAYRNLENLSTTFPIQLKKSILQYAVQGKLVPQDPADEPASVLLERIRAEKEQLIKSGKIKRDKHESVIFRRDNSYYERVDGIERCIDDEVPFTIPESWEWARLSQITSVLGDGIHGTPIYDINGDVAFINGNNLCNGKIVIKEDTKRVTIEESQKHFRPLGSNSVLVSINGTLGNIAFFQNEKIILGKSACYFNLLGGIYKKYIKLILETDYFQKYANKVATGTTIKNVPLSGMRAFLVPVPPTNEQISILSYAERLLHSINRL